MMGGNLKKSAQNCNRHAAALSYFGCKYFTAVQNMASNDHVASSSIPDPARFGPYSVNYNS